VRSRFGNGTSEWYKFIQEPDGDDNGGFAIGSASEDYITNTHSFYLPNPQTKAFAMHFAKYCTRLVAYSRFWYLTSCSGNDPSTPLPNAVISPDWRDVDV
jgi:hypothetical protein